MTKINYSPQETKIKKLLRKTPQTTGELADRFYSRRPFYARQAINALMTSLQKKSAMNGDSKVMKSPRRGPKEIEYWIEQ